MAWLEKKILELVSRTNSFPAWHANHHCFHSSYQKLSPWLDLPAYIQDNLIKMLYECSGLWTSKSYIYSASPMSFLISLCNYMNTSFSSKGGSLLFSIHGLILLSWKVDIIIPFFSWENWGLERGSDLEVRPLVRSCAWWLSFLSPGLFSLEHCSRYIGHICWSMGAYYRT